MSLSNPLLGTNTFLPRGATVIDGTWVFRYNGSTITVQMINEMFISMTSSSLGQPITTVLGEYFIFNPNEIYVYYAYGPFEIANQLVNGTFKLTGLLSLNMWDPITKMNQSLTMGMRQPGSPFWDGVWQGSTVFPDSSICVTTAEFIGNVWRGFQSQCSAGSQYLAFGSFVGTFAYSVKSPSSVDMTYAFVDTDGKGDISGLSGETITFNIKRSEMGGLVQVELTSSMAPSIMRLVKLDI